MDTVSDYEKQLDKVQNFAGFIAALDQSGGSTPKALRLYGVPDDSYVVDETSMYDAMHTMRERIITSPKFDGERILGVILFENTARRTIKGIPTAQYLWEKCQIVPFLKIDEGLKPEQDGVQKMKEIKRLTPLLDLAVDHKIFGTKARSFIKSANTKGIEDVLEQQFNIARIVMERGLHPIIEPEVSISMDPEEKKQAELLLKELLLDNLNRLRSNEKVLLKLTLPSVDNFYKECIEHPNVLRVVALSGGYDRKTANALLTSNDNMLASFSRALTEGLNINDSEEEFNHKLDGSIQSIYEASISGLW